MQLLNFFMEGLIIMFYKNKKEIKAALTKGIFYGAEDFIKDNIEDIEEIGIYSGIMEITIIYYDEYHPPTIRIIRYENVHGTWAYNFEY